MKTGTLVCLLTLLLGATSASGQTLLGRVFRVISGDQLMVIDSENALHNVRLWGIQAPAPDQPLGSDARTHLSALLLGRVTIVHFRRRDSARRIIGKVTHGGADVNLRQIQAGLAIFHPHSDLSAGDRQAYLQAQQSAKEAGLGIWRGSDSQHRARRRQNRMSP